MDFKEEELSAEELAEVEEHVERCVRCASLKSDLGKIRVYLKRMPQPVLSSELAARTQSMCQAELGSRPLSKPRTDAQNLPWRLPKLIWAALFSLIVMTSILVLVLLKEFDLKLPLTPQTVVVLTLMVQNAGMLFLSPILIRKFSSDNKNFRFGSMG